MSSAKKIRTTTKKKTDLKPIPEMQKDENQKQPLYNSIRKDVPSITVEDSGTARSISSANSEMRVQSGSGVVHRESRRRENVRQHSLPNHGRNRPHSASAMHNESNQGSRMYQSVNRPRSTDPRMSLGQFGRGSKKVATRSHSDSEHMVTNNTKRTAGRTYSEGDKARWVEEHKVETKRGESLFGNRSNIKGLTLDDLNLSIRRSEVPHRPAAATLGNFRGQIVSPEGIRSGFMSLGSKPESIRSSSLGRRNKEDAISYFVIRFLNNDPQHVYHPGEVVEGHVILDTIRPFMAMGIDLIIRARGSLTVFKDGCVSHRKNELYLEKTSRMLGRSDGRMVMITPGHYVSSFTYQLPNKLPSSILSDNIIKNINFKLDVSYTAQAVVFDEMYAKVSNNQGSPHVTQGLHLHRGDSYQVVAKPIKVAARQFKVVSTPDAHLLLHNLQPVCHSENLNSRDGIILTMETTIVYPGNEVEMHMDADEGTVKLIKGIKVELVQHIQIPNTHHDIRRTLKEGVHDPAKRKRNGTLVTWDTTMKMPSNLTPTYKEIINLVIVEYSLNVTLKLSSKQIFLKVPIEVRRIPSSEDQTETMPDFRMVTRFPSLSNMQKEMENGHARPEEAKVEVEYRYNSWIRRNSNLCSCLK